MRGETKGENRDRARWDKGEKYRSMHTHRSIGRERGSALSLARRRASCTDAGKDGARNHADDDDDDDDDDARRRRDNLANAPMRDRHPARGRRRRGEEEERLDGRTLQGEKRVYHSVRRRRGSREV